MLTNLITSISNTIGNFGWAVVLVVLASQLLVIPLTLFDRKNRKAKEACTPELRKIRKKYNANQLGVSLDDSKDMDPEVKKMSHDERSEAMANEISALYKQNHYHMWAGWIPTVVSFALIILLWRHIQAAAPEGFYRMTIRDVSGDIWQTMLFLSLPIVSLTLDVYKLLRMIAKDKGKPTLKASIIAACVSGILNFGLSLWITLSISAAIAIALLTLRLWGLASSALSRIGIKKSDDTSELS